MKKVSTLVILIATGCNRHIEREIRPRRRVRVARDGCGREGISPEGCEAVRSFGNVETHGRASLRRARTTNHQ